MNFKIFQEKIMNKKQKLSVSKDSNKNSFTNIVIVKNFLTTAKELNITEKINSVRIRKLMEKIYKRR